MKAVLFEVKSEGARDLVGRQKGLRAFFHVRFRRFIQAHLPEVNAGSGERWRGRGLRPRWGVALLLFAAWSAGLLHAVRSNIRVTAMIVVLGGRIFEVATGSL